MDFKFGLEKTEGTWNNPATSIYFKNYFDGYKPVQAFGVFGLISSTDNNFWILSEDDDNYWTVAKISEETIRDLFKKLQNNDLSDDKLFSLSGDILTLTLFDSQTQKNTNIEFNIFWIPSLIKTLDIDNPVITSNYVLPVWEKTIVPDKIEYPLMTPIEYFYSKIQKYPLLLANNDFEVSKFKILDQLLNFYSSNSNVDEFKEEISKKEEIDISKIQRLCNEKTYNGYLEIETKIVNNEELNFAKKESLFITNVFKEDLYKYPEAAGWTEFDPCKQNVLDLKGIKFTGKFQPCQNLNKEYSILWTAPEILSLFNDEWKKEIIWFYQQCAIAIEEGCFKNYFEFPTGSDEIDQKRILEMESFLKGKSKKYASEQYGFGVSFSGNVEEFLKKRWVHLKKQYLKFIEETIKLFEK